MRVDIRWLSVLVAPLAIWGLRSAPQRQPENLAALKRGFEHPPDDARIMMRWWWFGPAVTKPELEREMRVMKQGGIGGVEVQPVYPLTLDDPKIGLKNLPYLSPEFLDALTFTGEKARELGLRMDLTLCSGWPYGGPHIPITQAAGRLRVERVAIPADAAELAIPRIAEGEKLFAVFVGRGQEFTRVHQIGSTSVRVPADASEARTALFFISSRTRMKVKRAAVGAEGFVLDHYDREAVENHLNFVGEKLLKALAKTPPYAVFSDSLEVERSDWTGDFLAEFQKRRGYDLTPYLPALAVDTPQSAAVRRDWGMTLTELANERYLTPVREWARKHGTLFRSQTYGTPPVTLSSNALVDLPEGEGWQWRRASSTRWASSASHLYGRPVTSSETWTWLHSPVFRATPLDMKAEADLHFLEGINQLIGHGWPYSPPQAGEPGWRFYAAAVFSEHNPWWMVMPDIALYLQRVSYLLRQGQPVNDIAIYVPTDDAYARFTLGNDSVNRALDGLLGPNVIPQILDTGYNFDFIDDAAIAKIGIPYKILVLPGVERISLATYRRIEEYARKGGAVIATRRAPSLAPGLKEADSDTPRIREISRGIRVIADESKLGDELRAVIPPDLTHAPEIGFVHRKLPFADIYFLANTSNHEVSTMVGQPPRSASGALAGQYAAWWDPFTGKITAAGQGHSLQLNLAPYESRVLVFSTEQGSSATDAPYSYAASEPIDLSSGWSVKFEGINRSITMDRLHSWTDDEETKFFSGRATYERKVNLPRLPNRFYVNFGEGAPAEEEHRAGSGMRALLESPVREAALVYVNGKLAGSVWHPPYEIEVTSLLHAGENSLRIIVANLALNELAKGPLPDYKELNGRYGERFQPQDMQSVKPVPAGMLGPVKLVAR